MTNWIEIRDQLPPEQMQVLFYIKNKIDGYTEDFVCQGSIGEIIKGDSYNQEIKYWLKCGELKKHEEVAFWTLLPSPPVTWK